MYTYQMYIVINILYKIYIYIHGACVLLKPVLLTSCEAHSQSPHFAPVATAWPWNRLVALPVARCGPHESDPWFIIHTWGYNPFTEWDASPSNPSRC